MAQKARTCFFCGGSLEEEPRRRRSIAWADIALFAVIGGLLVFWWVRLAGTSTEPLVALAERPTALPAEIGTPELGAQALDLPSTAQALVSPTLADETAVESDQPAAAESSSKPAQGAVSMMMTPSPDVTATAGPMRHKVKQGETVLSIAGIYGSTVKDIIDANGLSANGFLRVGQELVVPVAGPSGGPGPTATPKGGTLVYAVEAGDTVSLIATRFGSTIDWILSANGLKPTSILHVGQSLLVPLGDMTPTPSPTVFVSPSPTATPGPAFPAPTLLTPADRAVMSGDEVILLGWISVGTLARDQWYVVTVEARGSSNPIAPYWTKSTTWRFPPDYKVAGQALTEFVWRVQVMTGTPGNPGKPASLPSALRRFAWE